MHQKVNFYIGALIITIVGSIAAYLIIRTDVDADVGGYAGAGADISDTNPEIPNLQEELEKNY